MAMELQEVAAMYSVGNLHGLSVNLGGGNTSIVPLYEGYAITSAIETMNLCGSDITEYVSFRVLFLFLSATQLAKLLAYGGNHFSTSAEMEIVRDIKEKLCYVASGCLIPLLRFDELQISLVNFIHLGIGLVRFCAVHFHALVLTHMLLMLPLT